MRGRPSLCRDNCSRAAHDLHEALKRSRPNGLTAIQERTSAPNRVKPCTAQAWHPPTLPCNNQARWATRPADAGEALGWALVPGCPVHAPTYEHLSNVRLRSHKNDLSRESPVQRPTPKALSAILERNLKRNALNAGQWQPGRCPKLSQIRLYPKGSATQPRAKLV